MSPAGRTPLSFVDHHRQDYADRVRIAAAGEFLIGAHLPDGSVLPDGEFRVELVELGMSGRGPALHPRLSFFGEGVPALRRTIDAGLLDALGPVADREGFARRLIAIGVVDRSDRPLSGIYGEGEAPDGRRPR